MHARAVQRPRGQHRYAKSGQSLASHLGSDNIAAEVLRMIGGAGPLARGNRIQHLIVRLFIKQVCMPQLVFFRDFP